MTRRNKVRLAVSWWKAIQTQEWFRYYGQSPRPVDLTDAYSYDAINHLYCECTMREAGIQEFFSEGHTAPLTIVYEDFILEYEMTIGKILEFLELDTKSVSIPPAYLTQLADDLSKAWTQRFRRSIAVLPLIDYHWQTYDNRSKVGRLSSSNEDQTNSLLL